MTSYIRTSSIFLFDRILFFFFIYLWSTYSRVIWFVYDRNLHGFFLASKLFFKFSSWNFPFLQFSLIVLYFYIINFVLFHSLIMFSSCFETESRIGVRSNSHRRTNLLSKWCKVVKLRRFLLAFAPLFFIISLQIFEFLSFV